MTDLQTSRTAAEMAEALQQLVDAIDRRVPQLQRLSEPTIARDAAELRERAVTLMRALTASTRADDDDRSAPPRSSAR
jgi:hypothetical protein